MTADPLGSAADEAVKLVDALRDLVGGAGAEHLATGAPECQVCPVCRLVALLRDADPQTVGRAADSVVSVVGAFVALAEPVLRTLVDTAVTTAQAASSRAGQPDHAPGSDRSAESPDGSVEDHGESTEGHHEGEQE